MSEYTIYKLVCNDEKLCSETYVGSTKAYAARKWNHQNVCNNPNRAGYNYKVYQIIRANGGWSAWRMVPIQVIPNTTKRDAEIRENELMEIYSSKLNTNKASIGDITIKEYKKQYNLKNKGQINITSKQYNLKNKEKIRSQQTCKCGCSVTSINLARHQKSKKCIRLMQSKTPPL
jgi:hypothetical protein